MVELGQLEQRYSEFAQRKVRIVVIANDDLATSRETQADFPHLVVVADTDQHMAQAIQVIHAGVGPKLTDTNAPTLFLLDGTGQVRWFARPAQVIVRLSPDEVLAAIDANLPKEK